MRRIATFAVLLMAVLLLAGCSEQATNSGALPSGRPQDVAALAGSVSQGVGSVRRAEPGNGRPVIILEERHESRAGQIQMAIVLNRLYARHGLRDIVLEGYLKDSTPIDTAPFATAVGGKRPADRASVAVRLLKEGEIGASEFVALVYDDVRLDPGEYSRDYNVELTMAAAAGPIAYVNQIGTVDRKWAEKKGRAFQSKRAMQSLSGSEHLKLARDIKRRAEELNLPLSAEDRLAMDEYMAFWQGRVNANSSMSTTCLGVQGNGGNVPVAINCGIMHSDEICAAIQTAGRPCAIIQPLWLKNGEKAGDLSPDQFLKLKQRRQSVFSTGLAGSLRSLFPPARKPRPFTQTPIFEVKSTVYAYADAIAKAVLPQASPYDKSPYGFDPERFKSKYVFVDPQQIRVVADPNDASVREALFPVQITGLNGKRKTLYVKVAETTEEVPGRYGDYETIERLLDEALKEVSSELTAPDKAEGKAGVVRVSTRTKAVISSTEEAARNAVLGGMGGG